jgi:hypothetical protein
LRLHLAVSKCDATQNHVLRFLPLFAYVSCGWSCKSCQEAVAKHEACLSYLLVEKNQFKACWRNSSFMRSGRQAFWFMSFSLHQYMQGDIPVLTLSCHPLQRQFAHLPNQKTNAVSILSQPSLLLLILAVVLNLLCFLFILLAFIQCQF